MPAPWNDWYHVTGSTYGTWLPGSDLGFRTRHHRRHIEGDYRNPPPPGRYRADLLRSRRLMEAVGREPVRLSPRARRFACAAFARSLLEDGIEVVAVAVDGHHFHLLGRFRHHDPRRWVGRAKARAAITLVREGLAGAGGVWGKRTLCIPITGRRHQLSVVRYIAAHAERGAALWLLRGREEKP